MTDKSIEEEAESYVSEEKEVKNVKEAIAGASDILAESVADEADYRIRIRNMTVKSGSVVSSAKKENEKSVYEMYYNFEEPISKLAGHRVLALNRGEKEKILTVKINAPEEEILSWLKRQVIRTDNPNTSPILEAVVEDSYKRLIAPAIEREIRNDLTEKAEDGSIKVFGKNLEQLLMQPPIVGKVVLGWDPAFRTGCKLAVVDETGKVLDTTVVYPTAPTTEAKIKAAKETVKKMIFVSCNIKRVVVENDPKEKGERAVLNFGHTIGHAVEKAKNFSLLHGECVAIGMAAATYISLKKGNIAEKEYNEINNVISDFKLPVYTTGILASDVVKATKNDKKMDSGVIKFITLEENGHAIIDRTISEELLLEATETVIRG